MNRQAQKGEGQIAAGEERGKARAYARVQT